MRTSRDGPRSRNDEKDDALFFPDYDRSQCLFLPVRCWSVLVYRDTLRHRTAGICESENGKVINKKLQLSGVFLYQSQEKEYILFDICFHHTIFGGEKDTFFTNKYYIIAEDLERRDCSIIYHTAIAISVHTTTCLLSREHDTDSCMSELIGPYIRHHMM